MNLTAQMERLNISKTLNDMVTKLNISGQVEQAVEKLNISGAMENVVSKFQSYQNNLEKENREVVVGPLLGKFDMVIDNLKKIAHRSSFAPTTIAGKEKDDQGPGNVKGTRKTSIKNTEAERKSRIGRQMTTPRSPSTAMFSTDSSPSQRVTPLPTKRHRKHKIVRTKHKKPRRTPTPSSQGSTTNILNSPSTPTFTPSQRKRRKHQSLTSRFGKPQKRHRNHRFRPLRHRVPTKAPRVTHYIFTAFTTQTSTGSPTASPTKYLATPDDSGGAGFFVTSNPGAETKSVLEEKLADVDQHEVTMSPIAPKVGWLK